MNFKMEKFQCLFERKFHVFIGCFLSKVNISLEKYKIYLKKKNCLAFSRVRKELDNVEGEEMQIE